MSERGWLCGVIFGVIGMLCQVPHSPVCWVVILLIVGCVSWVMADFLDKYINAKIDRAKRKNEREERGK